MCLNGDLERQFEFVQQTWVQSPTFHGLANERDPLIADPGGQGGYTIPSRAGPLRLEGLRRVRADARRRILLPARPAVPDLPRDLSGDRSVAALLIARLVQPVAVDLDAPAGAVRDLHLAVARHQRRLIEAAVPG